MRIVSRTTVAALLLFGLGCEVPAASGTVEIDIENLSSRDIDGESGILGAVAGLSGGACTEGPCSPNPCPKVGGVAGATACVGMGDVSMCRCPAGTHEEMDQDTMEVSCVPDENCMPTTCNNRGQCTQMDMQLTCECIEGFTGPNCDQCDSSAGWFPDGLGSCSQQVEVCREGQGTQAFQQIIMDAEEQLGHAPTELEIAGARLEAVEGSMRTVRSWNAVWRDEVTLVIQTVSGFPIEAGSVDVPDASAAFDPLEFDMSVTRPETSKDEQFFSGDWRVGVRGPTDLQITEEFGVDLKLVLDVNAY